MRANGCAARPHPIVNIIADQPVEASSAPEPGALNLHRKSAFADKAQADKISAAKEIAAQDALSNRLFKLRALTKQV